MDLTNNYALVHGGNLTTLAAELQSGLAVGATPWSGPGIISPTAAADTTYTSAVGMIPNNNNNGSVLYGTAAPLGLFDGYNATSSDVLIRYTYFGDTNLDGHVDGSDFSNIDNGYLGQLTGWYNGDFNYDNSVDGSDYALIDNACNRQGASIAASIAVADVTNATAAPVTAPDAASEKKKSQKLHKPLLDL